MGPKLGDDAVGNMVSVTAGVKFGDIASVDTGPRFEGMARGAGCAEARGEDTKFGEDDIAVMGVVAKRVGKLGDEGRATPGAASGTKAFDQMAPAPSST
jgi:hypothetical protein